MQQILTSEIGDRGNGGYNPKISPNAPNLVIELLRVKLHKCISVMD